MAYKRAIFEKLKLKFDENLKEYSYMEDLLFSYSIHKKYPNSLYITPYAKCIHKVSREGRDKAAFFETPHLRACRKYVLMQLFGVKGLLIFFRQTVGLLLLGIIRRILSFIKTGKKLT